MRIKVYKYLHDDAIRIRREVFIEEQGFSEEFDDIDTVATHIVAYEGDAPTGTCRLFYDERRASFVLGRLAVRKPYRGAELGSLLIREAEAQAAAKGGHFMILHSQCVAIGFYRKNRYQEFGDVEDDEGCPHIWMKKNL